MDSVTSPSEFIYRRPPRAPGNLLEPRVRSNFLISVESIEEQADQEERTQSFLGRPSISILRDIQSGLATPRQENQEQNPCAQFPKEMNPTLRRSIPCAQQIPIIPVQGGSLTAQQISQEAINLPEQMNHADRRVSNTVSITESTISRTLSTQSSDSDGSCPTHEVVRRVQNICLEASRQYLRDYHINREVRGSNPPSPPIIPNSHGYQDPGHLTPSTPKVSEKLINNISTICDMMWVTSQGVRHRIQHYELKTAKNMVMLIECGRTVMQVEIDRKWVLSDEQMLAEVVNSGCAVCQLLNIEEAIDAMQDIQGALLASGYAQGGFGVSS